MTHSDSAFAINCHLLFLRTMHYENVHVQRLSQRHIYIYILTIVRQAFLEIEKHKSLNIKVSGACCKLPDPIDTIDFESFVREKQTRSVIIMNDSNAPWKLKVETTGDYFSTDPFLQVPPLQLAPCVVTYAPIFMNTENTLHTVKKIINKFAKSLFNETKICKIALAKTLSFVISCY